MSRVEDGTLMDSVKFDSKEYELLEEIETLIQIAKDCLFATDVPDDLKLRLRELYYDI